MGFIRQQEERIAMQFLAWRYEKMNMAAPPEQELQKQAKAIVDDAHRIGKERGSNVLTIIKELINNIKKDKGL